MTEWSYTCTKCQSSMQTDSTLFDVLYDFYKGKRATCSKCNGDADLNLTFNFGLWKEKYHVKVIDVFLPDPDPDEHRWVYKSRDVAFYPFMVIVEDDDGKRYVWLPYWHVVKNQNKTHKRYGQWAPFIDMRSYNNVLSKAKKKGLL